MPARAFRCLVFWSGDIGGTDTVCASICFDSHFVVLFGITAPFLSPKWQIRCDEVLRIAANEKWPNRLGCVDKRRGYTSQNAAIPVMGLMRLWDL